MTAPNTTCVVKKGPPRDETWDKCIRRSSIGIGIGGLLGAVSSLVIGSGGVAVSLGIGVALAVSHCRSLFRKQATGGNIIISESIIPAHAIKTPVYENLQESKTCEQICNEKLITEEEPCPPQTFRFSPIIPIPDRPFGRVEKDDECSCVVVGKDEVNEQYQLECTCPIPSIDGGEQANVGNVPDFLIECNTKDGTTVSSSEQEVPSNVQTDNGNNSSSSPLIKQQQLDSDDVCTCPPIPQPECTCPPPPVNNCDC